MSGPLSWHPMLPVPLVVLALTLVLGLVLLAALRGSRADRAGWLLRAAMALLVALIVLRPGAGQQPVPAKATDLDVIVVLDRTVSMSAMDWDGDRSRLTGARADLAAVTTALPGSRFALITWGRYARTELPPSTDLAAFQAAVETTRREGVFDGVGSSTDRPLDELTGMLERDAEQHPDRRRIVLFLSDGELTGSEAGQEPESFADLASLVDDGLVLGYGTEAGGLMPYDDPERDEGAGTQDVLTDPSGQDARSRIDEANLRRLAGQLGVDYQHRTAPGGLEGWAAGLEKRLVDDVSGQTRVAVELYWVLAMALLALVLLDLAITWRALQQTRRELVTR